MSLDLRTYYIIHNKDNCCKNIDYESIHDRIKIVGIIKRRATRDMKKFVAETQLRTSRNPSKTRWAKKATRRRNRVKVGERTNPTTWLAPSRIDATGGAQH